MSEKLLVLNHLIAKGSCNIEELHAATNLPKKRINKMLQRIMQEHELNVEDEEGNGMNKRYAYVCNLATKEADCALADLHERAYHLLKASTASALSIETMVSILNISYADALVVAAHLVKTHDAYLAVTNVVIKHR